MANVYNFADYPTLPEIYAYCQHVVTRVGNTSPAWIEPVGHSQVGNLPIEAVCIGSANPTKRILINGLIHARERLSGSTLLWILDCLTRETSQPIVAFLQNYQVVLIPCLNPDGYTIARNGTTDQLKLWRKNTRDNLDGTFGVDLCRNFNTPNWTTITQAQQRPTNSPEYPGPNPFSESEVNTLQQYILTGVPGQNIGPKNNIVYYLDIHSFSGLCLYGSAETNTVFQQAIVNNDLSTFGNILGYNLGHAYGFYPAPNMAIPGTTIEWFNVVYQQNCYGAVVELEPYPATVLNPLAGFNPNVNLIAPVGTKVYNGLLYLIQNGTKFP